MPGYFDPFTPGPTGEDLTSALGNAYGQITDQIGALLGTPEARAGLLQAGIALMQPRAWGQTGAGAIGSAIGSAGEAVGRQETMNQKSDLAEAKARELESRTGRAADRAYYQERLLQQRSEFEQGRQNARDLQFRVRAQTAYQNYRNAIEHQNSLLDKQINDYLTPPADKEKLRAQKQTPLSLQEWLRNHPLYGELAGRGGGTGDTGTEGTGTPNTLRKDPAELARAKAAVKSGKDRAAVRQLLLQNGIDPEDL